jgi:DNA-binding CsgD family transcriptional regulator
VPNHDLTRREVEVMRLLAAGLSYREIATDLRISWRTVRSHVFNIYGKLDAHNRTEANVKWEAYDGRPNLHTMQYKLRKSGQRLSRLRQEHMRLVHKLARLHETQTELKEQLQQATRASHAQSCQN